MIMYKLNNMVLISQEYINYHNKYEKIYGIDKTIVLMQVGSFYETYSTETEGPDLLTISKILGIIRTRKNKSEQTISYSNPYMLGFPIVALVKFLEVLLDNDYTIVIIDQIPDSKINNKEKREVSKIYSKGTYIENLNKKDNNYIVCLYVSNDKQRDSSDLISVGLTGVDLSTGHVMIHEAYSTKYDTNYALDEADRFINTLDPKELLVYYQDNTQSDNIKPQIDMIKNYLKLDNDSVRFSIKVESKYSHMTFQNEILKKVYDSSNTIISPIEYLNLTSNIYALISLTLIFDFVYNKNEQLIKNLYKPVHFIDNKHLILGNNAIRQLDVLENTSLTLKCKYRSLFHVVNNTSTAMGNRFLKNRLVSPLIDSKELNKNYNYIEYFINHNLYVKFEQYLNNIKDIERLHRKMELNIIKPFEINHILSSYENILEILQIIESDKFLNDIIKNVKLIKQVKKFIKKIKNTFNMDELDKYSTLEIDGFIFKDEIYEDIDKLKNNMDLAHNFMDNLRTELNKFMYKGELVIKKNDRDGYYLYTTQMRAESLKIRMKKVNVIKINNIEIDLSLLEFNTVGKNVKIRIPSIDTQSDNMEKYRLELIKLNKRYFQKEMISLHKKYLNIFNECNLIVAFIDFIKSNSKTAILYGYSKPNIIDKSHGYINAKQIRHPIVERIIDYEYVPQDIELGDDKLKGMLVYGINTAGKTTGMKAVGLSIIMAQAGMYVPATSFDISPYHSLLTRISTDDNMFRGLSSFGLEMTELNSILKRNGKYSFVIADELTRGTEFNSGCAIVGATIIKLSECGASFIFTTHLHKLMEISRIKNLINVKPFHLSVSINNKTNELIYDRILKEGIGLTDYGLLIATHIIQDKDFIDIALDIKNEILEQHKGIISGKKSRYNSDVYVYECGICETKDKDVHISNLETHHINFQKDCESQCPNGVVKKKRHLKKNDKANLIVLCSECHDKIHNGKITLNGYKMSSNGKKIIIE